MSKWGERLKHVCQQCGKEQLLLPAVAKKKKYCSNDCKNIAVNGQRKIVRNIVCACCSKKFTHDSHNGNRGFRFCSYECAAKVRGRKQERPLSRLIVKERIILNRIKICPMCNKQFIRAMDSSAKYCSKECSSKRYICMDDRKSPRTYKCKECDKEHTVEYGDLNRLFCSNKCLKRYYARLTRTKRDSQIRQFPYEPINIWKVFARDNWTCKICGCHTPKDKRGLYDDDAPELDHVIPLAKGGSHTYSNVQLLCRACNGIKSDSMLNVNKNIYNRINDLPVPRIL